MKYFLLSLILVLSACSLNKNSSYWNEDLINDSLESKKLSQILKKTGNFKKMTFDEFNLFLKNYYDNSENPDINN